MARNSRLPIRLAEKVHEDLRAAAEARGVTMSALAAHIIGEWLMQQGMGNKMLGRLQEQLQEQLIKFAQESIDAKEGVKARSACLDMEKARW